MNIGLAENPITARVWIRMDAYTQASSVPSKQASRQATKHTVWVYATVDVTDFKRQIQFEHEYMIILWW